jgi:hypothetical protein
MGIEIQLLSEILGSTQALANYPAPAFKQLTFH